MEIVESFFYGSVTYDPLYTKLEYAASEESQDYWKPKMGRQYLYYNVSSLVPHELHSLVCLWILENAPKVVYLRRKDYLMRAISRFYAAIVWEIERDTGKKLQGKNLLKVHQTPLCFETIDRQIRDFIIRDRYLKKVIDIYVSAHRLLEVSHFDIFYSGTETLQKLVRFLESDTTKDVNVRFSKQTNPENIPNRHEATKRYRRELTEMQYWMPGDLDMSFIEQQVEGLYKQFLKFNSNTYI